MDNRRLLEDLLTEFCARVDGGEGARVAELFTSSATLETPHFQLSGREAIGSWFAERAAAGDRVSRHFWSNLRVSEKGRGTFCLQANAMTFVGSPPTPSIGAKVVVGTSIDTVIVEDGRALFESRRLEIALEGEIQPTRVQS